MQDSSSRHEFMGCDVWVPATVDEVWNYFADPKNLAELTPPSYGAKIFSKFPTQNNSEVEISLAPLGIPIPLKWISKITDVVSEGPKRKFIDTQIKGPFAYWRHEHLFEEGVKEIDCQSGHKLILEPVGTWVRDRIEYEMPLGSIGRLAHSIAAHKSLIQLMDFRRQKLLSLFKK